ncbi:MAG: hypothetical protein NUW37_15885 [Planctomycetes bacterium]|nr:hypothetical protein [Planctomycetota bacterium]
MKRLFVLTIAALATFALPQISLAQDARPERAEGQDNVRERIRQAWAEREAQLRENGATKEEIEQARLQFLENARRRLAAGNQQDQRPAQDQRAERLRRAWQDAEARLRARGASDDEIREQAQEFRRRAQAAQGQQPARGQSDRPVTDRPVTDRRPQETDQVRPAAEAWNRIERHLRENGATEEQIAQARRRFREEGAGADHPQADAPGITWERLEAHLRESGASDEEIANHRRLFRQLSAAVNSDNPREAVRALWEQHAAHLSESGATKEEIERHHQQFNRIAGALHGQRPQPQRPADRPTDRARPSDRPADRPTDRARPADRQTDRANGDARERFEQTRERVRNRDK